MAVTDFVKTGPGMLSFSVDGVNRDFEVSSVVLQADDTDSDFTSLASARAGGGTDWSLAITFAQAPGDAASLWSLMWDHAGSTYPFVFTPLYGTTGLHLNGTLVVGRPSGDVLGGDADPSVSQVLTTDVTWKCVDKPTLTRPA